MNASTLVAIVCAFVVTFLAVGIPYWQIPYSKASLPSSLYDFGMAVVFLAAAILRMGSKATFMQILTIIGLAVPVAVMARVQFETALDPTSHNLWPFEIAIASGLGFAVALAGTVLGGIVTYLRRAGR